MSLRPTFYAFEIARSAIALNQKWLDVTGQNLANVETPGYSRQRVVQTSIGVGNIHWQYKLPARANVGLGVSIDSIDIPRYPNLICACCSALRTDIENVKIIYYD